jgi:predicted metalloprotease with PDZ domain
MKHILLSVLFFLVCIPLHARIWLSYHVSVAGSNCLKVEMEWSSEANRQSQLVFTPIVGSGQNLTWFRQFQIESSRTIAVFSQDSTQVTLIHDANSKVKCSYLVPNLQNLDARFASLPKVQPEYFHAIGYYLFAALQGYHQGTVQLDWSDLPRSWEVFNSYQQGERNQTISVNDPYWQESLFAGGIIETHETQLKSGTIRSYFLGEAIKNVRPELEENVIEACVQQRKFWHEDRSMTAPFVAVFLPMSENGLEMTGIGLKNAFSVFVHPEEVINPEKLRHLVYHEMMHHWIGQELRMTTAARNTIKTDQRWFIEGFTEYFTYLTELQSGELSISDYCNIANQDFISPHYSQNVSFQTRNDVVVVDYMAETLTEKYPYHLGFVYACFLDAKLADKTNQRISLRDLMELLMERTENQDGSKTEMLFLNLLYNYLGEDILKVHQNITQHGERIPVYSWIDSHPMWQISLDFETGIPKFSPRPSKETKPEKLPVSSRQ